MIKSKTKTRNKLNWITDVATRLIRDIVTLINLNKQPLSFQKERKFEFVIKHNQSQSTSVDWLK